MELNVYMTFTNLTVSLSLFMRCEFYAHNPFWISLGITPSFHINIDASEANYQVIHNVQVTQTTYLLLNASDLFPSRPR